MYVQIVASVGPLRLRGIYFTFGFPLQIFRSFHRYLKFDLFAFPDPKLDTTFLARDTIVD
jgi:hypothetical protein